MHRCDRRQASRAGCCLRCGRYSSYWFYKKEWFLHAPLSSSPGKPHGLLPLLEEQCLLSRAPDDLALLSSYHRAHLPAAAAASAKGAAALAAAVDAVAAAPFAKVSAVRRSSDIGRVGGAYGG